MNDVLDTNSPIPLYYQLRAAISERLESGQWKPGDRVPSESELGERFRVSRTTVRQALGDLTNQGLLTRIQGRGTFVAYPRIQQRLTQLTGFTQDMHSRGKQPGAKVLQSGTAPAPKFVANALKISTDETVIILKRLRLADGEPMAVETSYLLHDLCREVLTQDLAGRSLYEYLTRSLNIIPIQARQQLEAVVCPPVEARLLGIRKGSPVLKIHRTTLNQFGQPFEQVESYYRGDRYVFQVELFSELVSNGNSRGSTS